MRKSVVPAKQSIHVYLCKTLVHVKPNWNRVYQNITVKDNLAAILKQVIEEKIEHHLLPFASHIKCLTHAALRDLSNMVKSTILRPPLSTGPNVTFHMFLIWLKVADEFETNVVIIKMSEIYLYRYTKL